MSDRKEIIGRAEDGMVTLMFIDTILEGGKDLYHRAFYVGDERSECIDAEKNIYLVAIDQPEDGFQELYEMVNTTVCMLRDSFGYDFSKEQEFWLADEQAFHKRARSDQATAKEKIGIRNRVFWNDIS